MAILDLITIPNPILKQKCVPVTNFDSKLEEFVNDMFDTMHKYQGIGLAAPQVGILEQICICEYDDTSLVLINPKITKKSKEVSSEEGCLSIPGQLFEVSRFEEIEVAAQNIKGEEISFYVGDMLAIVIQHEIDHLEGTLITDSGKFIKEV